MKILLLIPSFRKTVSPDAYAADSHPMMDYDALAQGIESKGACTTLYDFHALAADRRPLVTLAARLLGKDFALAVVGWLEARRYDAIFTNSESIGIFLALLLRSLGKRRPRHVTIAHRLSTGKKALFFKTLAAHREIDTIFVYATTQLTHGTNVLGIPQDKLRLIPFHADHRFWRPRPEVIEREKQVSAAGLEWRDYPTLIAAAERMPDTEFPLAAASPWSKHTNETEKKTLPGNVAARRYSYEELRELYTSSAVVAVPLYENDFQAGITSILEAMACGKAVVVSQTVGQTDAIIDGINGLYVAVDDPKAWETALRKLQSDPELRATLGQNARRWIEENATLDLWVDRLVEALLTKDTKKK